MRKGTGVITLIAFPAIRVERFDVAICIQHYPGGYMMIFENGNTSGFSYNEANTMLSEELKHFGVFADSFNYESVIKTSELYEEAYFSDMIKDIGYIKRFMYLPTFESVLQLPEGDRYAIPGG